MCSAQMPDDPGIEEPPVCTVVTMRRARAQAICGL